MSIHLSTLKMTHLYSQYFSRVDCLNLQKWNVIFISVSAQTKYKWFTRMTFQKIIIDLTGVTLTFLDRNVESRQFEVTTLTKISIWQAIILSEIDWFGPVLHNLWSYGLVIYNYNSSWKYRVSILPLYEGRYLSL